MPSAKIALGMFDGCLKTLGLIREGKKRRDEKIDQALFALYAALNETKSYVENRQRGKRRNQRREFRIAHLWDAASVPLRNIDKVLASRCFAKGNYWMDPQVWTEDRIKANGITWEDMFRRTRDILLHS
jgi:hypothetical protein